MSLILSARGSRRNSRRPADGLHVLRGVDLDLEAGRDPRRSWAPRAWGRARCCTSSGRSTGRPEGRSTSRGGCLRPRGPGPRCLPEPAHRLCVPVPPPAARVHRRGERHDAGPDRPATPRRDGAGAGRGASGQRSVWSDRVDHKPHELSGGSSSGWRSPAASSTRPAWSSPTSRPGTWTRRPRAAPRPDVYSGQGAGPAWIVVTHNESLAELPIIEAAGRRDGSAAEAERDDGSGEAGREGRRRA